MNVNLVLTGKTMAALALMFIAMVLAVAGTMSRGTGAGPVDSAAIVQGMIDERDHVTPTELAHWVIDKKQDYQLIDLRQPWQFDDYHIPTAVNVPLSQFFQEANLKQLDRSKKIVVYGLGAGHAAQTQLLLQMKGYNAYSLREGISAWWDQVITPTSLRSESTDPAGYQQAKQLRECFFGGAGASTKGSAATPAVNAPILPPETQPGAKPEQKKLKLGKGCS